ncbi:alpha/beta hydrolase [Actinoplanes sp. NBRC 103695]|uniref:alpha/beta fold hydrolase n=1 Tax=Actinoplanes sp. NBRC 103695 TaxID=3032202 RepID=UPI0024A252CC|nr:alpha/beta hydrolase [Actinoplanes sp. NBRC 103695]GLY97604.1 epoxide hydrolase [Actinoplanes sp. NBRC 103695]
MRIEARGLTFDVAAGGPEDGTPVLLLHGFPQDHREFELILPELHAAGLRTFAYDQRGYAPGARPADVAAYTVVEAASDALAILDELGVGEFHLVGHDWGAVVSWVIAALHPQRVRTLTAVSVPHIGAMAEALRTDESQRERFGYQAMLAAPDGEDAVRADDFAWLRQVLAPIGDRAELYIDAMRDPGRLTGGINWYRARAAGGRGELPKVSVPTTFVWSDQDAAIGEAAARLCAEWVTGDYELVTVAGVRHWVPEEAPGALADAALARIGKTG